MVRYWRRERPPRWRLRATLNGVGAATTGLVDGIVIWTKFTAGAWMVTIAIPVLIACFYAINRHYRAIARRLRAEAKAVLAQPRPRNTVILYVERLDTATREALWYARAISSGDLRAIHVPFPGSDSGIRARFARWSRGLPHLEVLSPEDDPLDAVLEYVWGCPRGAGDFVTVVVPELFRKRSLAAAVVRRSTFSLKLRLLREPGVVVTDVPRVADVHAASLRALLYARSLGTGDARAVHVAFEPDDARRVERAWRRFGLEVPLDVVEAPYRDLGGPLRAYLARATSEPGSVAVVVMPELVVRGPDRLLHNQRALFIKRLRLFEPNVILASVPYQLG